jgi:hypothetical protein
MENPVSRCFVLPLTWFDQVAHDGHGAGETYALRRLHRWREAEHLMTACHQDLDQSSANE